MIYRLNFAITNVHIFFPIAWSKRKNAGDIIRGV